MRYGALWLLAGSVAFGQECAGLIQQSRSLVQQMQLRPALVPLNAALERCADRNLVRVEMANVHYLLAQDQRARELLQEVLAAEPEHEEARYALGRIYYQQSRHSDARNEFQRVLDANPLSYRAHDNLALCLEALGQNDDAIRHYLRAIELVREGRPEYDWPYANLGSLLLKLGRHRQAFDLGVEAATRNPSGARNFFLTGKALTKLEKWETSVRWLRQAVELDPEYPEAHYLLAQAYRKLGRAEEAREALERFREARAKTPTRPR